MTEIVKNFYNNNFYSVKQISKIFNINKSTIHRWINLKKMHNENNTINTIETIIINEIENNKLLTIKELQNIIKEKYKKNISISGIYVHLKNNKYTYKKINKRNYNNLDNIKTKTKIFKKEIKKIKLKNIISIDETCIMSNIIKDKGWTRKGTKIYMNIKSNPKKYNILMAVTNKEIIKYK